MNAQRSNARLAVGIIVFFAMIAIGALLWAILNAALTPVLDFGTGYSTSATADQYLGILTSVWGYALFFVLFIAGFALVGRAVVEGRVR